MEAEAQAQRLKQQQTALAFRENKQEFVTREKLFQAFQSWADRTPPNAYGLNAFYRSSANFPRLTVRNLNGHYFLEVPILQSSVGKMTPGLVYGLARSGSAPDLPVRFALPESQVETLLKWLSAHDIAYTKNAFEARGAWEIEGYFVTVSVSLKSDRDRLLSIVRYLIDELFEDAKPPYFFSTQEREGK